MKFVGLKIWSEMGDRERGGQDPLQGDPKLGFRPLAWCAATVRDVLVVSRNRKSSW